MNNQPPQFTTDSTLPEVPVITASVLANDLDNCIIDIQNAAAAINKTAQRILSVYNDLTLIRNQLYPEFSGN